MPVLKENTRIIYEGFLGKKVRHYQWQQLKAEMEKANLPINRQNLQFIANCKRMAPRKAIASEVLENVVQCAVDNSGIVKGAVIKGYIQKKHPRISRDKFYRAFRDAGWNFSSSGDYPVNELGQVFYKLFV